jgi:hypothetical protein
LLRLRRKPAAGGERKPAGDAWKAAKAGKASGRITIITANLRTVPSISKTQKARAAKTPKARAPSSREKKSTIRQRKSLSEAK